MVPEDPVKRLARAGAVALAAAAAVAAPAHATRECTGFPVCVSVAGPWVVVPAGSAVPRSHVLYRLACPKRFVVGGLDAQLSNRGIDVFFGGALGSPVNPGITTSTAAVFDATYTLGVAKAPTFRPLIGCVPARGGGTRVPTAVHVFPPGKPTAWRVKLLHVRAGRSRSSVGCAAGERLVGASHAVGFMTAAPPARALVRSVVAKRSIRSGTVSVSVRATRAAVRGRAVVQVAAICAGGQ